MSGGEHAQVNKEAAPALRPCFGLLVAVALVLAGTGQSVTLPIYADAIGRADGTPYFVVWFCSLAFVILFGVMLLPDLCLGKLGDNEPSILTMAYQRGPILIGLCDALNGMLIVFASPSHRTAPYLQALLGNFAIPMTIAIRALWIKEMPQKFQLAAASLVLAGLFVSLIPNIFSWDQSEQAGGDSLFWPAIFMLGFIPGIMLSVLQEVSMKREHVKTQVLPFVFFMNMWQLVFVSLLFWLDVVPGFGMSSDIADWAGHMQHGLRCSLPGSSCGSEAFLWELLFILSYMITYVASTLLMRHTEGAVWQAVITSLVGPLSTAWWAMFQPSPSFHFAPHWSTETTFAVLGLAVMIPGMVLYHIYGQASVQERADMTEPLA